MKLGTSGSPVSFAQACGVLVSVQSREISTCERLAGIQGSASIPTKLPGLSARWMERVSATTIPLVEAILRHPTPATAPAAIEILAWAAAVDTDNRFGTLPRSFRLRWEGGVINYGRQFHPGSRARPPAAAAERCRSPWAPAFTGWCNADHPRGSPSPGRRRNCPPPSEPPVPTGHLLTVGAYLGYESGRRGQSEETPEAVRS